MSEALGSLDPTASPRSCLNCGAALSGAFCSTCGQAARTGRLTLRQMASDATSHLLSLDTKVLRTLVGLTLRPGQVAREYVGGHRVRYVPPLRYCLTMIALLVLGYAFLGVDPASTASALAPAVQGNAQAIRQVVSGVVARHLNLILATALPFFAAFVWMLFRRKGFNYTEVTSFVLYVMGQLFFAALFLAGLRSRFPVGVTAARALLQVVYFSWAARAFFRVSTLSAVLRTLVATVLYFVVMIILILAVSIPGILEVAAKP